jgi:hypothetical protein
MTSITNENNPNTSSIQIKSESALKKLDADNIITTSMELDENILLKEKLTLISSDKNEILSKLQSLLETINLEKEKIEKISLFICDKIYKYRNLICEDIFSLIFSFNHIEPKIEFLCLITEIFQNNFGLDKSEIHCEKISSVLKKIFIPYIQGICQDLYTTLVPLNQENVFYFLNEWEKKNFLGGDLIKQIKFVMKFMNEPNITGSEKDAKYLMNLVNCGNFKIEQNLMDFSRSLEALNRNKDNFRRKNMLKIEKDLLQKQIKTYNTHMQQLKEINLLLNKIKEHPELFDKNIPNP